jgi:NadR type nicotinamide-nucleotide adenylyltransferase
MKRGLIVGKFYPPHAGHHYLIETGLKHCDELTVAICDHPEYLIPAKTRVMWLSRAFPTARVVAVKDLVDDDDSAAWAKLAIEIMGGTKPDVVFTSEDYGKPWSEALGCEHFQVDIERATFPCSGTAVRADPFGYWNYISPDVKGYFALRICLVGAESTGKTTLSKALA